MSFDSINEELDDNHKTNLKISTKYKNLKTNKIDQLLSITNKKPTFLLKSRTTQSSKPYSDLSQELTNDQTNSLDSKEETNISNRSSFVKNICNLIENKIQNTNNLNTSQDSNKKFPLKLTFKNNEHSVNDINFTLETDVKSKNNNNNNDSDEKKEENSKSKNKEKSKDKEKEKSKKHKEESKKKSKNEKSDRKRSKSRDKSKERKQRSDKKSSKKEDEISEFIDINPEEENHEQNEKKQKQNEILQNNPFQEENNDNRIEPINDEHSMFKDDHLFFKTAEQDIHDEFTNFNIGTESQIPFKISTEFSTSTKYNEIEMIRQESTMAVSSSSSNIFQYVVNFLNATTPENKNLWLSIIESTGDSVINLLTLKDEDNKNIWLSWLKDQCNRLDQLSQDLIYDIETKIINMDKNKHF